MPPVNDCLPLSALILALLALGLPAAGAEDDSVPPPLSAQMGAYKLEAARIFSPFWSSPTVYGETVFFVQDREGAPAEGTLLFRPGKVLAVRNALTGEGFEEGRDYTVDGARRRLVLPKGSRIPFVHVSGLLKRKGEANGIAHKLGDPETWVLFGEDFFQGRQVAVDYERAEPWKGYVSRLADKALPRTLGKLRRGEPLRIALTGDSISAGANATLWMSPQGQPPFPQLFAAGLQAVYGSQVELLNIAVGGWSTLDAMKNLDRILRFKPDLVLVGYGMNDVGYRDAARYSGNIQDIMQAVRAKAPEAEFILLATSRSNPDWAATPIDQFALYRDALARLCGEHVALADLTALWSQMLERKRYHDLTGNGVNHPNDFGHRIYAQVLLGMLTKP
ncbi:MAG TPA: SGNH/GDSL hydrolase family protein [Armatimonadota bacterium]|jgi:lysophospholipase L1-like esterase